MAQADRVRTIKKVVIERPEEGVKLHLTMDEAEALTWLIGQHTGGGNDLGEIYKALYDAGILPSTRYEILRTIGVPPKAHFVIGLKA
jgi:hypothetical protein